MKEEHEHEHSSGMLAASVATVVLMLLNLGFLIAGGMFIYVAAQFQSAGWQDVFTGQYAWIGSTVHSAILGVGIVIIVVAVIGGLGAVSRNRVLLLIYAGVLVVTALLFIGVAVAASMAKSKTTAWQGQQYPAEPQETQLGSGFNRLYCFAQVSYYCKAQAAEIATLFGINIPAALMGGLTVPDACKVDAVAQLPKMSDLCTLCKTVNQYSRYNLVATWSDTSCPRSTKNQAWCGIMLLQNGQADDTSSNAPYADCRVSFLQLLAKWSNNLLLAAVVVCILLLAVLGFTLLVRAASKPPPLEESFIVDSPSP